MHIDAGIMKLQQMRKRDVFWDTVYRPDHAANEWLVDYLGHITHFAQWFQLSACWWSDCGFCGTQYMSRCWSLYCCRDIKPQVLRV